MNRILTVILLLPLMCGIITPACGEEHGHDDHHHSPAATRPAGAQRDTEHDHDHDHHHEESVPDAKHDHAQTGHDDHAGHTDEVKLTPEAIRKWKIRVEPATKQVLTALFTAPGRVAFNAEAMAHVGSLVPGRVVEIKARVGDRVKKDDELLVVESTVLGEAQSDYLQKRTGLTVAESAVEPAKQAYERARGLHEQSQGISLGEVQKRHAELKAAEGAALSAKAAAVAAGNRLRLLGMSEQDVKRLEETGALNARLSIRAPIAGRVIEREVTLGELVSPEKERLMVLADVEMVWVLAEVSEARLPQIAEGSSAKVQLAALPNRKFEGKVSHVSPAVNPDTRTASVRVEVPNVDEKLRPGMFATVTLSAGETDDEPALSLPAEAVQTVEGAPAVFVPVEGEANTFAKRAVKVGKPVAGMVPILDGLKEGDAVVVSGTFILKAELGKGEAGHEH